MPPSSRLIFCFTHWHSTSLPPKLFRKPQLTSELFASLWIHSSEQNFQQFLDWFFISDTRLTMYLQIDMRFKWYRISSIQMAIKRERHGYGSAILHQTKFCSVKKYNFLQKNCLFLHHIKFWPMTNTWLDSNVRRTIPHTPHAAPPPYIRHPLHTIYTHIF